MSEEIVEARVMGPYDFTEEQLEQVMKMASIFLPLSDIAVVLDVDAHLLREAVADRSTAVSKAYRQGKAASKIKLHQQEMKLASVGSPVALETVRRNLSDMDGEEY